MSEARTGKRFPLELPIKIHKEDGGGEHSGLTGNLSAAGVYIKADAALEMGSRAEEGAAIQRSRPKKAWSSSAGVVWSVPMNLMAAVPRRHAAWLA